MNTVDYSWHVLAIIKVSCLRIENLDKRKKKRIKYNPVITLIELTITNTPCYPAAITICLHPLCLKRCQKKTSKPITLFGRTAWSVTIALPQ